MELFGKKHKRSDTENQSVAFCRIYRYTNGIRVSGGIIMEIKRIAHRGFSSEAPENTRASFALAAEGAFFGVECDIWRTKDGEYVVSHDGHLLRMCGVDKVISELTCQDVCSYPVKSGKKRGNHPVQYLISFREYLSIMARSETVHPVVELKVDYTVVE